MNFIKRGYFISLRERARHQELPLKRGQLVTLVTTQKTTIDKF
jgi:hypothetical protein